MEKRKREKVEKRKLGKFLCVGFIVCKVIFCANKRFLCEFMMSYAKCLLDIATLKTNFQFFFGGALYKEEGIIQSNFPSSPSLHIICVGKFHFGTE
jgi:hypothetical protein